MNYIIARLKEGTTWAGMIIVAASVLGFNVDEAYAAEIGGAAAVLAGAVLALTKDGGSKE